MQHDDLRWAAITLAICTVFLISCDDKVVNPPNADTDAGVAARSETHGENHHGPDAHHHSHDHRHDEDHHEHVHRHGHVHEHARDHGEEHHHHQDECVAEPPRFGGVTACVGDGDETQLPPAYAEVVVDHSHQISLYLGPAQDEGSQAREIEADTLDVVMAWAHEANVFRSTIATLRSKGDQGTGQSGYRRYVGQLSKKYKDGGEVLLIAPIVHMRGERESFDLIIKVPPLRAPSEPTESNSPDLLRTIETSQERQESISAEATIVESHRHD